MLVKELGGSVRKELMLFKMQMRREQQGITLKT